MELRDCDCIRITHIIHKTDVDEAQLSALCILSNETGIVTEPDTVPLHIICTFHSCFRYILSSSPCAQKSAEVFNSGTEAR